MKISQLIKQLETRREKHGDIDVFMLKENYGYAPGINVFNPEIVAPDKDRMYYEYTNAPGCKASACCDMSWQERRVAFEPFIVIDFGWPH